LPGILLIVVSVDVVVVGDGFVVPFVDAPG